MGIYTHGTAETILLSFAKTKMCCDLSEDRAYFTEHLQGMVLQLLWSSPDVWLHQGTHQDRT